MKTRHIIIALVVVVFCINAFIIGWLWLHRGGETSAPPQAEAVADEPQQRLPPKAYTAEGFAFLHRERRYADATTAFEACIRAYPDHSDGYHGLAQAQREAGDPSKALVNHDRAIQLDPERPELYWERGVTYARMKHVDGAITIFEACLERNSRFANAHVGLGEAYRTKGDFKSALIHHDEAISLNPRSAWFHRERGNTYRNMGEQELANADFAKSRELEKKIETP
jgi:tetratricopeptide (TPR) repeat protein